MRETLIALYELQQLDNRVLELKRSAEAIPQKVEEIERGVEVMRTELGGLNAEADLRKKEQQEIESQIAEESAKHQKWKRRLMEIKTPREYQAMSREIELGERQVKNFEDTVVEIMQDLEAKNTVIKAKAEALAAEEARIAQEVAGLRSIQKQREDESRQAGEGRERLLAKLPKPVVRRYEQVAERRHGVAVAVVSRGACLGCNVSLRPQLAVDLLKGNSIETCPGCHRILVHEELLQTEQMKESMQASPEV